jgi:trimethylamine--corrinoid protein Co-methyltransferase
MRLANLKVLSEREIKDIHDASIDILENCGVKILNARMLSFLKERGLDVDQERQLARFSRRSVEDALSSVPERFEVFDRTGKLAFVLGDGVPKIAAGHNAVFWYDPDSGLTRESTVADVAAFSRICQALECIDMIGVPIMPQDVPDPHATLLYGVKAVAENSSKPIYFSTDRSSVNNACIELLRAAFCGDLKNQVYGICQLSSTAPLYWEKGVIDAFFETAETGVPISLLPEPIAGISAPYTLAGLLTVSNTEALSGIVMLQLLRKGMKLMYGNSWTTTDMRSGAALVGSTETTICRIAAAQLAKFYRIPSHTTAPNSDNHEHDEQNAWEKTFSQFCAVASGHDLIVNCGMFATGLTCSNEQLLMDEEISAMCKRIAAGIKVSEDTIAADVIKQVGPKGDSYLTAEHTMKWLHSEEYLRPRLSVRGPRAAWAAEGGKDTYALAKEKAKELARMKEGRIDKERSAKLTEIIKKFEGAGR